MNYYINTKCCVFFDIYYDLLILQISKFVAGHSIYNQQILLVHPYDYKFVVRLAFT